MPTATIRLFLAHGDPKRLRTVEISNWTGKAVAGPRVEFQSVLERDEARHSGIYFLTGTDPETGKDAVYIGEAEVIRDRLRIHLDRDFWNAVTFIVSKDENLTKAHIRYLEGRLIDQTKSAGRAVVMNGQASGSRLPESDREDMEVFLDRIHQLLPVLGQNFLVPIASELEPKRDSTLTSEIRGLRASAIRKLDVFLVLKGSQAVLNERSSSSPHMHAARERLISDGTLVAQETYYQFSRDTEFFSPSAAGAVIHGGNVNGLLVWKSSNGRTLKELEAEQT